MIDLEAVLSAARRAADNHTRLSTVLTGPYHECACGELWPCPAKRLLEEDVPALVYALEEAAP